jgi:hypothetical protein
MVQARRAAFTWAVGDAPSGGEASFLMENPRSGRLPHRRPHVRYRIDEPRSVTAR